MSVKVHEAYSLDSFQDRLLWWDDFLGDQLKDEWDLTTTLGGSGAVIDQQTGGIYRFTTGAAVNSVAYIDWNDIRSLLVSKRVAIESRFKINNTASIVAFMNLTFDGSNRIQIRYSTVSGHTSWHIITTDGGATTDQDSGVAIDTSYHIFRIECHTHGGNHVHFYIDGVECSNSPINTNVPDDATDYLQPMLYVEARNNAVRQLDADYVVIRQDM